MVGSLLKSPKNIHRNALRWLYYIDETDAKTQLQTKMAAFLATLPADEPELSTAEILAEIKVVRTAHYAQWQAH